MTGAIQAETGDEGTSTIDAGLSKWARSRRLPHCPRTTASRAHFKRSLVFVLVLKADMSVLGVQSRLCGDGVEKSTHAVPHRDLWHEYSPGGFPPKPIVNTMSYKNYVPRIEEWQPSSVWRLYSSSGNKWSSQIVYLLIRLQTKWSSAS